MQYPLFKKGDLVKAIRTTRWPTSQTHSVVASGDIGVIQARIRNRDDGIPSRPYYEVYFRSLFGSYYFAATDLEKV